MTKTMYAVQLKLKYLSKAFSQGREGYTVRPAAGGGRGGGTPRSCPGGVGVGIYKESEISSTD